MGYALVDTRHMQPPPMLAQGQPHLFIGTWSMPNHQATQCMPSMEYVTSGPKVLKLIFPPLAGDFCIYTDECEGKPTYLGNL
jgi:hypothetical protein